MYLSALWPHLVKCCCQQTDCLRRRTQDLSEFLGIREERPYIISNVLGVRKLAVKLTL